jgi:aerobic carbon-monoxide dehydrogenase medium subunit
VVSVPAIAADGIAASGKRIAPFVLFRPASVAEALDLLATRPGAALHAGGIDLVNRMKAGFVAPAVIALDGIDEIKGVAAGRDGTLHIGAATTHWRIEHDALVKSSLSALAEYVADLGNIRVRLQGTIGGNLMAAEPGYEMLAVLAALDAKLRFATPSSGARTTVEARALRQTPRASGELLLTISIPFPAAQLAWSRDLRPNLGVVAALDRTGDVIRSGYGAISGIASAGAALGIAQPMSPQDIIGRARDLAENWAAEMALAVGPAATGPIYVRHVLGVLMRRLLLRMAGPNL